MYISIYLCTWSALALQWIQKQTTFPYHLPFASSKFPRAILDRKKTHLLASFPI